MTRREWLIERGWMQDGQWWLPPSNLNAPAKCFTLRGAVTLQEAREARRPALISFDAIRRGGGVQ